MAQNENAAVPKDTDLVEIIKDARSSLTAAEQAYLASYEQKEKDGTLEREVNKSEKNAFAAFKQAIDYHTKKWVAANTQDPTKDERLEFLRCAYLNMPEEQRPGLDSFQKRVAEASTVIELTKEEY